MGFNENETKSFDLIASNLFCFHIINVTDPNFKVFLSSENFCEVGDVVEFVDLFL